MIEPLIFASVLSVGASAAGTSTVGGEAGMLFLVEAREGQKDQFETGYKRHLDWHRRNNDPWAWPAWEILTGNRAGAYLEGTFGHSWSGFDRRIKPAEDAADHKVNVDPSLSRHVRNILVRKAKLSRGQPLEERRPPPFLLAVTHEIKPGAEEEFESMLAGFRQVAEQSNWHESFAWYALVDGGALPSYLLVIPIRNFDALAPSERSVPQVLATQQSRADRDRHLKTYRQSVLSVRSELLRYRADLSYLPHDGQ